MKLPEGKFVATVAFGAGMLAGRLSKTDTPEDPCVAVAKEFEKHLTDATDDFNDSNLASGNVTQKSHDQKCNEGVTEMVRAVVGVQDQECRQLPRGIIKARVEGVLNGNDATACLNEWQGNKDLKKALDKAFPTNN